MYLTRTFGRWTVELYRRAIHLTRHPDPNCPDCNGTLGGWAQHGDIHDWDTCACLNQLRFWRLPLWPRPAHAERYPF